MEAEMNNTGLLRSAQVMERFPRTSVVPPISVARRQSTNDVVVNSMYRDHFVVILVGNLNKPVMNAIRHARLLAGETVAVHIQINLLDEERIEDQWKGLGMDIALVGLESADGSIIKPLTEYIDRTCLQKFVTILLQVLVGLKWWHRFLHNQTARLIEKTFQGKARVVTIRVPFSLTDDMNAVATR